MKKNNNPRYNRGFFGFKSFVFSGIAILSLFMLFSCNEHDNIGMDLIDNPLQFSSTDTITVAAHTQLEDSLYASKTDYHVLGFINDPLFGKTRASIYLEALPAVLPPVFTRIRPDSLVVDSVVLTMRYVGYSGDITKPLNLRVFQINEEIPIDSVYSNKSLGIKNEIVVTRPSFIPNPLDSFKLDTAETSPKLPAHLRISIDPAFGYNLLTTIDSTYTTAAKYREFFKGLMVTVDEADHAGSMLYFTLFSEYSGLTVYYRKIIPKTKYNYSISLGNQTGRRFNSYDNYNHQFTSQIIREQVIDGDTLKGDSLLFLQSMGNYRVKIELPHIDDLLNSQESDFAINSARLILPMDDSFNVDSISLATSLILYRENPEKPGELISLADQFLGAAYFGGNFDKKKKEYFFNITRHLQMILEKPELNTPLYLRVSGSVQNASRVVLKGPGRENPLRLEIKYTQPVK